MKKIKIVHVQVTSKLTGAQLFSVQLFSALPDELYDKYLISSATEGASFAQRRELAAKYGGMNVTVIWLPSLKRDIGMHDVACFMDFYKLFKLHQFDIVHTNSTKPGITARIAARLAGVKKIIHTVHGISYHAHLSLAKRIIYYLIEAFSSVFGDYNICVNRYYIRYYKWLPFCESLTIYNGYDFNLLRSAPKVDEIRSSYIKSNGHKNFNILFVGRLDDQKDPITLLQGFKLLLEQHSFEDINYTLSLVGDGELHYACQQYCINNGLQSLVTLHGWSSNTAAHYQLANLFVCPSIFEAFGFTFVEAAYFGLPIVASNVEGIPEVVLDGEMGYLVPASSPQCLADAIYKIASNPVIYEKFSQTGRDSVIRRFNLKKMTDSYRAIYEEDLIHKE